MQKNCCLFSVSSCHILNIQFGSETSVQQKWNFVKRGKIVKSERNILIALLLNLLFSIFEIVGGIFTGSVAIISDAVHDMGDATSIAIAYILERKSKKQPDDVYTYGYARYSVVGSVITTMILLLGSCAVIYNAFLRLISPTEINYNGMIIFAVVGAAVNFCAALFTRDGHSMNQRAVNLHMLEDVLGWIVVLAGAVVMRFTGFSRIDPILSVCVAVFILIHAIRNLKDALDLFLEKTPKGIDPEEIRQHILAIDGVSGVHHIHVWSLDGYNNYATMHVVTDADPHRIKDEIRNELREHGIGHVTLELEGKEEHCHEECCLVSFEAAAGHHHHHHHH